MTPLEASSTLSLLQLTSALKHTIDSSSALQNVWVAAEVSDLRSSGGHAYLVLLQKDEVGNITAKLRATIWRGTLAAISARIGGLLRQLLVNGNEVRICGSLQYHPQFGLSFNISAIDPLYCRDTSRIQQQILAALRREGIEELNKQQLLVMPPQRIAVISSGGAAGYGDFMNQLLSNTYGFVFYPKIFEAVMQGASTSESIRTALERIEMCIDLFDCVVIIRGGGATSDLAGFDDLELGRAVARFPMPIAVGIGHERDNTVLDYIAHTRLKTPTAVAEWLVTLSSDAMRQAEDAVQHIARYVQQRLHGEEQQVAHLNEIIPLLARHTIDRNTSLMERLQQSVPLIATNRLTYAISHLQRVGSLIQTATQRRLATEEQRLVTYPDLLRRDTSVVLRRDAELLARKEELIHTLDPRDTLRRGYSITRINGHAIRNADEAEAGAKITTTLLNGTITSEVTSD